MAEVKSAPVLAVAKDEIREAADIGAKGDTAKLEIAEQLIGKLV